MDESGQPIPTPQAVDLVTIAAYRDLSEALVLKGRLNSAGIACFLVDDNIVRLDWFWSYLMKGVKLRVPATEAEIARSLVRNEGEAEPGEMEIPVCPRCGSRKIRRRRSCSRNQISGSIVPASSIAQDRGTALGMR